MRKSGYVTVTKKEFPWLLKNLRTVLKDSRAQILKSEFRKEEFPEIETDSENAGHILCRNDQSMIKYLHHDKISQRFKKMICGRKTAIIISLFCLTINFIQ